MIPQPSIVATDDNEQHLRAIVRCFERMGTACLPLVFTEGSLKIPSALSAVRLLFFDLNYVLGAPPGPMLYEVAAGVLRQVVRPGNGPYVLITWSSHEYEHENFLRHVNENCEDIPPPAVSAFLDKAPFIAGGNPDAEISEDQLSSMACRIRQIVDGIPQVSALIHWEDAGRAAAGDVITSLIELVPRENCFLGNSGEYLEDILLSVARKAVGCENVEADRANAIDEGLGPILFDRLIHATARRRQEVRGIWKNALPNLQKSIRLSSEQAALLNTHTLISSRNLEGVRPGDRGAVSTLCDQLNDDNFKELFGIDKVTLSRSYIAIKRQFEEEEDMLWDRLQGRCQWRLVGSRAACDQAYQRGATLRRVCLALEVPENCFQHFYKLKHGASYWTPVFKHLGALVTLIFNWHYAVALTDTHLNGSQLAYRLREPLISDITTKLHVHGLRPGIISYP